MRARSVTRLNISNRLNEHWFEVSPGLLLVPNVFICDNVLSHATKGL